MMNRIQIKDFLHRWLFSKSEVLAMWEGGSASAGRLDALSDLDLSVVVQNGSKELVLASLIEALRMQLGIRHLWRLPEPTWHGQSQWFIMLDRAEAQLTIDCVVFEDVPMPAFLEIPRHGAPLVSFDRTGLVQGRGLDEAEHKAAKLRRFEFLRDSFPFFRQIVAKEIARGHFIDAFHFYYVRVIGTLVELLRMKHCPDRFDFGMRYLFADLPRESMEKVETLIQVQGMDDLNRKFLDASQLLEECISESHLYI